MYKQRLICGNQDCKVIFYQTICNLKLNKLHATGALQDGVKGNQLLHPEATHKLCHAQLKCQNR